MKVNLIINGHSLSGHVNIDPYGFGDSSKVAGDVFDIGHAVQDSEATEILAHDIINFTEYSKIDSVILNWVSKLRHGGVIVIGGKDLWHVSKCYSQRLINTEEFNKAVFGNQEHKKDYRQSHVTMTEVVSKLESLGLKVLKKRVNGYEMVVEAVRV